MDAVYDLALFVSDERTVQTQRPLETVKVLIFWYFDSPEPGQVIVLYLTVEQCVPAILQMLD